MKYIIGKNRSQTAVFSISMEEAIDQDNEVRIIDLFMDSLDVEKMGFNGHGNYKKTTKKTCSINYMSLLNTNFLCLSLIVSFNFQKINSFLQVLQIEVQLIV